MKRTKTMVLSMVGALTLGGTWFWTTRASRASDTQTVYAAQTDIIAPGTVESASERVELAFEVSGRVEEVLVKEGDRVKKGQLLARLESSIPRARVAKAEAALAAAVARRDEALRGPRAWERKMAEAEAQAAEAQARERANAKTRAEGAWSRENMAISIGQVEAERDLAAAAQAQAEAARARSTLVKEGTRVEVRRQAAADVLAAEADLAMARAQLEQTELHAPRDGVVMRRYIEPGENVTSPPLTVVMAIADVDNLIVRAEIDEADIAAIGDGLVGYATAEAFGDKQFSGKITRIESELGRKQIRTDDPRQRVDTRVLEVRFALDASSNLPIGLRMDVHLTRKK